MRFHNSMRLRQAITVAAIVAGHATIAGAQLATDEVPQELRDVGVEEHLDAKLPLAATFRNERGEEVELGSFFERDRPVLLTLNYYRCPMLCGLQLNGLVAGLEELAWTPGQEFEMVTISIDPLETPALAAEKKRNYIERYGRPSAASGWHFLTGRQAEIERVAETLGFSYARDPATGEYAHAAVVFVATPDGRVARYLYGVEYPPKSLRLALLEAADGKIGSPLDQLLLYCHRYDPDRRRYSPVAMNIMRVGGGATVLALGGALGLLWLREARRRNRN